MVAETPAQVPAESPSADDRVIHLSAYVQRPLHSVLEAFAAERIDDLLDLAVQAALAERGGDLVSAHASTPVWVSSSHARVPVTWSSARRDGEVIEGTAELSLLMVQSGQDAITELLVALPVGESSASAASLVMHRVLDELTARLEDVARELR